MKKIIAIVGFLGLFVSQAVISSAGYFNSAPVIRCETQITRTLQIGSENNDVYILQNLLINAGFLNVAPNGYFGYQTAYAVRAFQMNNGIPATGSVGPLTQNAINERLCDTDLVDNTYYGYDSYSYNNYGYSIGTTYVGNEDPFVRVITPPSSIPTVYTTPQNFPISLPSVNVANPYYNNFPSGNVSPTTYPTVPLPSAPSSQIASTNIVYSPSIGYTYGITPKSGSITITSPITNGIYQEGDTVLVRWGTDNIQSTSFSILLESTITSQSKVIAVTSGSSYSFILTKELLDAICSGSCNNNQQGSFRIVVTTPTTDIAGKTSTLRAVISPITVRRPLSVGRVSLTTSKTPVNTGEVFKLYVNIPSSSVGNAGISDNYVVKLRSICPQSVSTSIAGTSCGQDFIVPFTANSFQQEVPVIITNPTWYKQEVTFQLSVMNSLGQTIGTGDAKVIVNGAPFSW